MDGSMVAQWDGVARKYSLEPSALDTFYRTGETYTNTIAVSPLMRTVILVFL